MGLVFKYTGTVAGKAKDICGFLLRFFIYHFLPMVSTTVFLILLFIGGMTMQLFLYYMGIVLFCCLLLAVATLMGK